MSKKTKKRGKKHLEGRLKTLSPGADDTQAPSALPAMPRRTPWRTVGAGIVSGSEPRSGLEYFTLCSESSSLPSTWWWCSRLSVQRYSGARR